MRLLLFVRVDACGFYCKRKEVAMSLGRVLVVDDEQDILTSIRLILTKAGYNVVTATDGEEGIAAIKSGDNALLVDTIILDLYMPKVNGMEASAYFRSQFPSVPIIILTGHPDIKGDRKSTRLNSSHLVISYAVFCLKKKIKGSHVAESNAQTCPHKA